MQTSGLAALQVNAQGVENTLYDAYGPRWVSTIYSSVNEYKVLLELLPQYDVRDLGAVHTAAVLLVDCGARETALALYEKALARPPAVGEVQLLEEAISVASQAGLPTRAAKWQDRLAVLRPTPAPKNPDNKR